MQQITVPGEIPVDPSHSITTSLFEHAQTHPGRPAVAHRVGGSFVDWSTRQFVDEVFAVAKGLVGLGIEAGSRICLMAPTRLEWTLLDYAIWTAGCVPVPIYETSSSEQVEWIVSNSQAKALIVADNGLKSSKYDPIASSAPLDHIYVIDEGGIEQLKSAGAEVADEDVHQRRTSVTADDEATLVYTSGTTGRPKGCVITHRSFLWDVQQVVAVSPFFAAGESTYLFLPLAHIFARVIEVGCITAGVKLVFSTGLANLLEELSMVRPSFLLAVPRVFEKVFNGAQQRAHGDGKGAIFDKAAQTAIDYSTELQAGKVSIKTKLQHAVFDKLVYSKLRAVVGGNVKYAVSGGAALGERLGHFFRGAGITILEGYGLTETTAAATINRPDELKIGTVGKPLPGCTVAIAADSEVLIKGENVFHSYYANEEATNEAIVDGWFHTGDLGSLDSEGFLRITGRKKEIIVTAGGKNVAPAVLEDRIRGHHLVSQAMAIGDNQPFIAALVTIDPEAFEGWAANNGKAGKSVAEVSDDPVFRAEIQNAIDDANNAVSKAESIRTFRILPNDFEVGDELSQKQSVKRHVVSEKYADVIAEIYAGTEKSGV